MRQRQVVGDAQSARESLSAAIFADHAESLLPALVRLCGAVVMADADPSASHGLETEDRPQQSGTSGAEQSGDAEDFAAMQGQGRVAGKHGIELEDRVIKGRVIYYCLGPHPL